jgi:putative serine protease PepD
MDSSARSRLGSWVLPGVALLTVATAAAGCASGSASGTGSNSKSGSNSAVPLQDSYESVVRTVLPSIMQISAGNSTGSGVVYDNKGDIVTNAHVVGDAKTVEVLPASGKGVLPATVVGVFKPDDLAVIRVTKDASTLKMARFGNSDDASIGEIVLAMGNPLGLTDSVTQGIVSAVGRTVSANEPGSQALITSAIQTSAAINPGNSGGALVALDNEVIGIPTLAARLPDAGAAPGIGFAIPSNTVRNIANQLIKNGKVTNSDRASLGITAQTAANEQGQDGGVAIVGVQPGGAAAKAGLKPGDIIIAVNGQSTPSLQVLESAVAMLKPGTTVTLTVVRNGSTSDVKATLGTLSS